MQQLAAGAAHVGSQLGPQAGAAHVGAQQAGAAQVGAQVLQQLEPQPQRLRQHLGRQHLGLQQRVRQHLGRQHLLRWQQLEPQLVPQLGAQVGAQQTGAAQVGAQAGAHIALGAAQLQSADACVAAAQQNKTAAVKVVHFIMGISWKGVCRSGTEANPGNPSGQLVSCRPDARHQTIR